MSRRTTKAPMSSLWLSAAVAVLVTIAVEAAVVLLSRWEPPLWALLAMPPAAGAAAFLTAGRLRAVRRRHERRRVVQVRRRVRAPSADPSRLFEVVTVEADRPPDRDRDSTC